MMNFAVPGIVDHHLALAARTIEAANAALGEIDVEAFIQDNGVLDEIVVVPELAGRERRDEARGYVVFESVARVQRRNGDVFFLVVRVDGRIARDGCGHFLYSIGRGSDDGSVRFANANVAHIHLLVRGAVAEDELAKLLHARVALNADANDSVAFAGAVVFKSRRGVELLDDKWFLRVVRRGFLFGAWGCGALLRCGESCLPLRGKQCGRSCQYQEP